MWKRSAVVVVAGLVAGCGGSSSGGGSGTTGQVRNAPKWTEAQVMKAAGLTTDDGGTSYKTASGCEAAVVMTTKATVDLYSDAGDTVVTNPDGTAGVKVVGASDSCLKELQAGLSSLK